jgi:hypothetical protein
MGARQKLNTIHVVGSVGLAGLLGLLTGSVTVFVVASAVMIGAAVQSGKIRGKSNRDRQRR